MALINGLYIHVTDEKINKDTDVSSHSVESGINVTDTVKPKQIEISLSKHRRACRLFGTKCDVGVSDNKPFYIA